MIKSDGDKNGIKSTNLQKLSINFELYSRAVSTIEKQLLKVNSDTFTEKNESYEITENYQEMIEDLNNIELENVDYVMVLADITKSIQYRIYDSIIENYEKILNKRYYETETEEYVKENLKEGIEIFQNKLKDMEIFLKEMSNSSIKKQNKLCYLKIIINKIDSNLKNLEEDYRNLFQKFNTNQPVEIDEETERLLEENTLLLEQKEQRDDYIEKLNKQIDEKDNQIFDVQNRLDRLNTTYNELRKDFNRINNEYSSLKKNYDVLLNEIYEKIKNEENTEDNKKTENNTNINENSNTHSWSERDTIIKLKDKLITSEENKKIFDMNYEQLILYTLNVETFNKQLEEKNVMNEARIRELEKEVAELTKISNTNAKNLHLLKSENSRLQNKINDLNKDIEINNMFRPSNALAPRVSRLSKMNDRISNIANTALGNNNRFKKMQQIFEVDGPLKNQNNNKNNVIELKARENPESMITSAINGIKLDSVYNPRLSNMTIEENNLQFNNSSRKQGKLQTDATANNNITSNTNQSMINNSYFNITGNPNISKYNMSLTNTNTQIFSHKDSFNDKYLFESPDHRPKNSMLFDEKNGETGENNENLENYGLDFIATSQRNSQSLKPSTTTVQENKKNKEVIMDYIDEEANPFGEKNQNENQGEDMNDSVNLNVFAKHSNVDIDINEIKEKRDKKKSRDLNNAKKHLKIQSLITEEIAEEDAYLETTPGVLKTDPGIVRKSTYVNEFKDIRTSDQLKSTQHNQQPSQENDKDRGLGHNRMQTMELDMVINKDSQYMCYDFLTLRKNMAIIKMLEENWEDVSSYEMFSDNVFVIDENNKKSKKYLFITSKYNLIKLKIGNSVYVIRPYDITAKSRFNLKNLNKITISNKNCNLIVRF